jgi:acetoin:2,6-dichlorophenolindophenol oxidoreductase subunit alpha
VSVRERAQDADGARNAGRVEPLEAAAHHRCRDAVTEVARAAEAEGETLSVAGGVERGEAKGGRLKMVARSELDLGVDVAPVRRQLGERLIPGFGEGRRSVACARPLRSLGRGVGGELELAPDPFAVEPVEETADDVLALRAGTAGADEADLGSAPPGEQGCKERARAGGLTFIRNLEPEPRLAEVGRQSGPDLGPLSGEAHQSQHKLSSVAKVEQKGSLSSEELRDFFRDMLLIRRFEEKVEERFRAGELPGFLHVAIGQEAVAVGVCRALEDGDVMASTHRAHGHTLARGTHPNEVMAELYGKLEGCSHGYGGSMHLYDVERGNLGANAVVGGGLPAIVGAALAFQFREEPRVAVAFFGDGATNIGTFHESLNLAQLWRVPAVFVCENNHWAESTPAKQQLPIEDLSKRAEAYGMHAKKVDGQDVEAVYAGAVEALEHAREGKGPVFLLCETFRLTGHYVGDPQVYRPKGELQELRETQDPVDKLRGRLELSDEDFEELDREVVEMVEAAVEFAKNGTDPKPEDALNNVYA